MLTKPNWINLIFENRNKQYGAYQLRASFVAYQSKSLAISAISFTILILGIYIFQYIQSSNAEKVSTFELPKGIREKYDIKEKTKDVTLQKVVEVELPLIQNWKLYSDKDYEKKIIKNRRVLEEKHSGRILEEGVMKYAIDPKTGKDYVPEKAGSYKGGYTKLYQHILKEIKFNANSEEIYPHDDGADEIDFEINTMIWIQCELKEDGSLGSAVIFKGASDPKFNERVLQAVKSSTDWIPAQHKGKKIKQMLIIPFHFNYMQPLIKYYP